MIRVRRKHPISIEELAKSLKTTVSKLKKEKYAQKKYDEFWSDPCWTE